MAAGTRQKLTASQQEVLKLLEQGKSVKQIARKRGTTPNAVHATFRKLREAGYEVGGNGNAASNGGGAQPGPAPERATVHGVAAVKAEAEAQRAALEKDVENKYEEAASLRKATAALEDEINALNGEVEQIKSVIASL